MSGGDFNSNPTGAPTWNSSAHGARAWNQAGAARLGSNGTSTNDYFGTNDLAARVDATAPMSAINEPVDFSGPLVTDAFRFWFDNPGVDYGYALRLAAGSRQETKFGRWEQGLRDEGPMLSLTYLLPGATPRIEVQRAGPNVRFQWPIEHTGFIVETTTALPGGWIPLGTVPSTNATVNFLDFTPAGPQQFFRLTRP